jgi:hypothetical protein
MTEKWKDYGISHLMIGDSLTVNAPKPVIIFEVLDWKFSFKRIFQYIKMNKKLPKNLLPIVFKIRLKIKVESTPTPH